VAAGADQPAWAAVSGRHLAAYTQNGTNTKQRGLRHLFTWLEEAYDHPHSYTSKLNRYSAVKTRPSTLAHSFIADLLEVTGGGRARTFEDARDHAMIRVLTEGVRRTELIQIRTSDLAADLMAQPFVRVVPLKGTRNRGAMLGSGLYRMLQRWAEEAGYDPAVHPHQFRHTSVTKLVGAW
jgi:integrase/recombinase XerD